jgi:hypothetical protein
MPLNYKAPARQPETDEARHKLNTLIMLTMRIGINEITEATADEVYTRIAMLEKTFGAFHHIMKPDHPEPLYYTREDIRSFIGLYTNASKMTRARFEKTITEQLRREVRE